MGGLLGFIVIIKVQFLKSMLLLDRGFRISFNFVIYIYLYRILKYNFLLPSFPSLSSHQGILLLSQCPHTFKSCVFPRLPTPVLCTLIFFSIYSNQCSQVPGLRSVLSSCLPMVGLLFNGGYILSAIARSQLSYLFI